MCLPPHTAYESQPLETSVFKPLKQIGIPLVMDLCKGTGKEVLFFTLVARGMEQYNDTHSDIIWIQK